MWCFIISLSLCLCCMSDHRGVRTQCPIVHLVYWHKRKSNKQLSISGHSNEKCTAGRTLHLFSCRKKKKTFPFYISYIIYVIFKCDSQWSTLPSVTKCAISVAFCHVHVHFVWAHGLWFVLLAMCLGSSHVCCEHMFCSVSLCHVLSCPLSNPTYLVTWFLVQVKSSLPPRGSFLFVFLINKKRCLYNQIPGSAKLELQ